MTATAATRISSGFKAREARTPVNLPARMRTERGWCDVTIRNVSSGGFMAQCAAPPRRGFYIEIWRGEVCIVGCVAWSSGSRFGARSQEKINVPALISKRLATSPGVERRRRQRDAAATPPATQVRADRARQLGRAFEFAAVGIAAAGAALFLASAVGEILSKPFAAVRAADARSVTANCRDSDAGGGSDCPEGL